MRRAARTIALLLAGLAGAPSATAFAVQTVPPAAPDAAPSGARELPQDPPAEAPPAAAATPIDFDAAVASYRSGDYAHALAVFSALALAEPDAARAAVLHANAGTAAARADLLGEAVWHLRTARALDPDDAVTRVNLERVRVLLGEGGSDASRFTTTVRELPLRLTLHQSQVACGVAVGLALVLLALRRTGKVATTGLAAAVVLLAGAGLWLWVSCGAWHRLAQQAVVIDATVNGRAEPDALSEILFRLPSGSIVAAEEERRGWRLVESEAGARGWMPAEQVRPLAIRQ